MNQCYSSSTCSLSPPGVAAFAPASPIWNIEEDNDSWLSNTEMPTILLNAPLAPASAHAPSQYPQWKIEGAKKDSHGHLEKGGTKHKFSVVCFCEIL